MERLDKNFDVPPNFEEMWLGTLKEVLDNSYIQHESLSLNLDEQDLSNLRWIYSYAETGYKPPPEKMVFDGENSDLIEDSIDSVACFNQIASVHNVIDLDIASEVMKDIMSQ